MKTLVIYDSAYGNTEKVAQAIGTAVQAESDVRIALVSDVTSEDIANNDMLFIGSPTQGGRPTQAVQDFIHNLDSDAIRHKSTAAFDTRFALGAHSLGLKLLMKTIGFAAPKIMAELKKKGAQVVGEPAGFIVGDKKGPLDEGEIARAVSWAQTCLVKPA